MQIWGREIQTKKVVSCAGDSWIPLISWLLQKKCLQPSTWAARKAEFFEKVMEWTFLRNILKIDRRLTLGMKNDRVN